MCTVTYLPYRTGYILTHNRDEAPTRSPDRISKMEGIGGKMLFPRDTKAGGAWVVAAQNGQTACLLNGAFLKHQHRPPYRRSRGLLLLDFFEWPNPDAFFAGYELDNIEPFTFLFFDSDRVIEFRWDGSTRHLADLPANKTHFWCSATLYPPAMQEQREQIFRNWLGKLKTAWPATSPALCLPSSILKLHLKGSVGDPENDFVMDRGGRVCTVSITQIVCQEHRIQMQYFDLLDGYQDTRRIRRGSNSKPA